MALIVIERTRDLVQSFLCAYGPFETVDEAEAKCVEWRAKYPSYFSIGRLDPDPALFYDKYPIAALEREAPVV